MNDTILFYIHGGGDHGEGFAGMVAHLLVFLEQAANQPFTDTLAVVLPGISALPNIHPLIVHFPIAFLTGFWLLDSLSRLLRNNTLRAIAGGLLYLGTLTAGLAVWAGLNAAETIAHDDSVHEIMEQHEHLAIIVLITAGVLSLWRLLGTARGLLGALHNLTAFALLILVLLTADLGGLMVYQHGVAVAKVSWPEQHDHVHQTAQESGRGTVHDHGHDTTSGHAETPEQTPVSPHSHDHDHQPTQGLVAPHSHSH